MKLNLEVIGGPMDGLNFEISQDGAIIGREDYNTVPLPYDRFVSREHAKLEIRDNEWIIEDLKSTNGTFIDGERIVDPKPLNDNMIFKVGRTDLLANII